MILNRFCIYIFALILTALALPILADGATPTKPDPMIDLQAQNIRYDMDDHKFFADGHVKAEYGDEILRADSMQGDLDTGDVVARGNVEYVKKDKRLKAETFNYNFNTEIGSGANAVAKVGPIFLNGTDLTSDSTQFVLHNADFTTCNAQTPHYYLHAKELIVQPGKQLIAKHVTIVLLGRKLFTVPSYSVNLNRPKETGQTFPMIGARKNYGAFVNQQFDLSRGSKTKGLLDVRLSTKQILQLGISYDQIDGKPFFVRTSYRLPYYGGSRTDLLVSRLPEVGMRFVTGDVTRKLTTTQDQLDIFSGYTSVLGKPKHPGGFNAITEVGLGEFAEYPTGISSARADARFLGWLSPIKIIDPFTTISPGIMARHSVYAGGKEYSVLGYRLSVGRHLGHDTAIEMTYAARSPSGSTPFQFDQIDLSHELDANVYFPVGAFNVILGGRYNLQNDSFFDSSLTISRTYHCLTPKIIWRNRFSEFSVGLGIVAF
jgi:lipopolysaccharide export system protein LptA